MKLSLNATIALAIAVPTVGGILVAALSSRGFSAGKTHVADFAQSRQSGKTWGAVRVKQMQLAMKERNYIGERKADARKALAAEMEVDRKDIEDVVNSLGEISEADKADAVSFQKSFRAWWDADGEVRKEVDQARPDFGFAIATGQAREPFDAAFRVASAGADREIQSVVQVMTTTHNNFTMLTWLLEAGVVVAGGLMAMYITGTVRRCMDLIANGLAVKSREVEATAGQVSEAASKLSQASTEQAASLQQTAASSEELTAMVVRNQESSQQATHLTESNQATAQKGQQVVQDMATAIMEINSSNQDIMNEVFEGNRKVSEITKVIAEIGDKTKVINDIVFQTKLLSFNASVEAARAGEHGRGFAVVAEEVGNLAAMSGTAAKEISDMLESSIQKVESIVRETRTNVERLVLQGKEKVEAGTRIVSECSSVLDEIVTSVTQVSMMSRDISVASDEQARGVKEISHAVSQLDSVVHGNASTAEQAARAAETLNGHAKMMQMTAKDLMSFLMGDATPDAASKAKAKAEKKPAPKKESSTPAAAKAKSPPKLKVVSSKSKPAPEKTAVQEAPKADATGSDAKPLKLAAGAENEIPSADDPRFKDI